MGAFDIQGKNCVFQLKIDDDYKTVVCAKSFTFNPVTDMKETTTVGSGFWKEFRPRKLSYTITFNGMYQVESASNQEKIKTLFDYQIGFLPLPYRIIYTDNSSNVMVVEGWVYVTSTLLDASPVNLVNGTIELQGNGIPTISDVIPDLANINIVSLGDPSISAVFQFKLFDSTGAVVFDSGQLPGASGGNLTHPVNVTGTVQKGTYSIFWQALANSIGNTFQLDAPPTKSELFDSTLINESTFGIQDYDFTADRTVTFTLGVATPPPSCVPPAITGSPSLPNGQVSVPYLLSFPVTGSEDFLIDNIVKPSWMTIVIIITNDSPRTYAMLFTGTPNVAGTAIDVSFDVNNPCGSVSFSDTIDVAAAPVTTSYVSYNYDKTNSGVFRIYVNSVLVIERTDDDAASFSVNPGDVVEVQVLGNAIGALLKKLKVVNFTDSIVLFDEDNTITAKVFSWTIDAAKFYTVEASNHS